MNGLPYYKAYPRDFIEGTIGLPFELKAAYRLVLDLIYMQGGALPDDDRYIAGLLGCSVRKWGSLRAELVRLGKIYVSGGFLRNYRADKELETLAKLQDKQRENRARPNKIKEMQSPRFDHTEPDTDIRKKEVSKDTSKERRADARSWLVPVLGEDLADAFLAHRKAMKAPMTDQAGKIMAKKLASMADPGEAIRTSIERGWKGVFADDPKIHPFPNRGQTRGERYRALSAELDARIAKQPFGFGD